MKRVEIFKIPLLNRRTGELTMVNPTFGWNSLQQSQKVEAGLENG